MTRRAAFWRLTLHTGGSDVVCPDCQAVAVRERRLNGELRGVGPVGDDEACCAWCGIEADE